MLTLICVTSSPNLERFTSYNRKVSDLKRLLICAHNRRVEKIEALCMSLTEIHGQLSNSAMLYFGIAGAWGLVAYIRNKNMEASYWGILILGELLFVVQGVIGFTLWAQGFSAARGVHILYGIVSVLTLPGYFALSKGKDDNRATFAYGLICLFLVGVGLRATSTAIFP